MAVPVFADYCLEAALPNLGHMRFPVTLGGGLPALPKLRAVSVVNFAIRDTSLGVQRVSGGAYVGVGLTWLAAHPGERDRQDEQTPC